MNIHEDDCAVVDTNQNAVASDLPGCLRSILPLSPSSVHLATPFTTDGQDSSSSQSTAASTHRDVRSLFRKRTQSPLMACAEGVHGGSPFVSLPSSVVMLICSMMEVVDVLKLQVTCWSMMRCIYIGRFSFAIPLHPDNNVAAVGTGGIAKDAAAALHHLRIDSRWALLPLAQRQKLLKYFSHLKTVIVERSFFAKSVEEVDDPVPGASVARRAARPANDRQLFVPSEQNVEIVIGQRTRPSLLDQQYNPTSPSLLQARQDDDELQPLCTARCMSSPIPNRYRLGTASRLSTPVRLNPGATASPSAGCPTLPLLPRVQSSEYHLCCRHSTGEDSTVGDSIFFHDLYPCDGPTTDGTTSHQCDGTLPTADSSAEMLGRLHCSRSPSLFDGNSPPVDCHSRVAGVIDVRWNYDATGTRLRRHSDRLEPCRSDLLTILTPRRSSQPALSQLESTAQSTLGRRGPPFEYASHQPQSPNSMSKSSDDGAQKRTPYSKKLKAFEALCAAFDICIEARRTLESLECQSIPTDAAFVLDSDSVIPELPVKFVRDPESSDHHKPLEFSKLQSLTFGKTIDCRHIVPLIDFCIFPNLRQLQIGVVRVCYQFLNPRFGFGRSPTVVLAPQLIYNGPDYDDVSHTGDFYEPEYDDRQSSVSGNNRGSSSPLVGLPWPEDWDLHSRDQSYHTTQTRSGRRDRGSRGESLLTAPSATTDLQRGPARSSPEQSLVPWRADRHQQWTFTSPHLPAIYNGALDGGLRFEGPGVYSSHHYTFEGSFEEGLNSGYGVMVSRDSERYEGFWLRGRRHGKGKVVQADQRVLDGDWWYDVFEGRGTMSTPQGLKYQGEWRAHTWHGWGSLSLLGRVLVFGEFSRGLLTGWGRAIAPDGTSWTDAIFSGGELVEERVLTVVRGDDVPASSNNDTSGAKDKTAGASSSVSVAVDQSEGNSNFIERLIGRTLDYLRDRVGKELPRTERLQDDVLAVAHCWPTHLEPPLWLFETVEKSLRFDI